MTLSEVIDLLVATAQGAGTGAVFLLVLFIGFCVLLGYVKLRPSGPRTLTVRSLDEALGTPVTYLPPSEPRGITDQLAGSRPAA
ncbi:MAG: hypothetical protein Q7V01_10075 [Vicinamibacterales bacterium]|nr:hypothetical protein [Vicinamibacterales bacterium]